MTQVVRHVTCPICGNARAEENLQPADGPPHRWCPGPGCDWYEEIAVAPGDGEPRPPTPEATEPTKPTQSTILLQLAEEARLDLFRTSDFEAFARLPMGDHHETWSLRSRQFQLWLRQQFYLHNGQAPNRRSLLDTIEQLEARARFSGQETEVHTRVAAGGEGQVFLDLCNEDWEVVEITGSGWRILQDPPVRFRRARGMLALPRPEAGGSIAALRPLVNVADEASFALLVGWLVGALRPRGPYPILVLHGEQGSAKSTLARICRALIDPSTAPLRTIPANERDLMITATNSWMLAFDNLSGIKDGQSDALCRLATLSGLATRQLYTDSEEALFSASRPVTLNGIEEVARRQDLIDRCVILLLPTIDDRQRTRSESLWAQFEALRPQLLGALLDAVSCALRREGSVQLERSPRMADFAYWVVAAEMALPWNEGTFLAAYEDNRSQAIETSLENDLVASAVLRLVREEPFVEGTCEELLARFEANGDTPIRSRSWPRSPRALSSHLTRLAPALRQAGVDVRRRREPGSGRRLVCLEATAGNSDRHLRHDRHSRPSLGPVQRDGIDGQVTEPPADRHGDELGTEAIPDGRDGCDGLDGMDDSEVVLQRTCTM